MFPDMMESTGSNWTDFFEFYARYCNVVSRNDRGNSREELTMLSKSLESTARTSDMIWEDLCKLMSHLNLSVDSRQFTCFYNFVFFICRENGQKNLTVNRAITAWRLVLNGRFRLLNQWCDFVEKHQRHNISEDTWKQLLAFSRCVHEDLEGYDPKGAWPVLIDDFVEHMYRINQSRNCSTRDFCCHCGDIERQPSISNNFHGLKLLPGSKRKSFADIVVLEEEALNPLFEKSSSTNHFFKSNKLLKQTSVANKLGFRETDLAVSVLNNVADYHVDTNKHNSFGCLNNSACAVEDNLSKGFEGHLSIGSCFQFNKKSRVSYT